MRSHTRGAVAVALTGALLGAAPAAVAADDDDDYTGRKIDFGNYQVRWKDGDPLSAKLLANKEGSKDLVKNTRKLCSSSEDRADLERVNGICTLLPLPQGDLVDFGYCASYRLSFNGVNSPVEPWDRDNKDDRTAQRRTFVKLVYYRGGFCD